MNILRRSLQKIKRKLINSKDDALMVKICNNQCSQSIEVSLEDTKLTLQDDTTEKLNYLKS